MSLMNCLKCGATIGARLVACPYCKHPAGEPVPSDASISEAQALALPAIERPARRPYWPLAATIAVVAILMLSFFLVKTQRDRDAAIVRLGKTIRVPQPEMPATPYPPVPVQSEMDRLKSTADFNEPQAQFEFGRALLNEAKLWRQVQESLSWFRKAAAQGHGEAQSQLGWMYYEGLGGVPRDEDQALHWFLKAGAQGDTNALAFVDAIKAARIDNPETNLSRGWDSDSEMRMEEDIWSFLLAGIPRGAEESWRLDFPEMRAEAWLPDAEDYLDLLAVAVDQVPEPEKRSVEENSYSRPPWPEYYYPSYIVQYNGGRRRRSRTNATVLPARVPRRNPRNRASTRPPASHRSSRTGNISSLNGNFRSLQAPIVRSLPGNMGSLGEKPR